ncbi:MAG: DUF1566 domain-containing protein [Candidatus Electrothrix sp. AW1]|nr:DUF1566 domain-containing protein [Candidatus Electrothrix sp. AX1]MCI5181937.1 DUF1566 domain-containing protein [Candidatus Electrothrix gigas]
MAERAEKRYAILIGSSKYPNEPGLTELRCPEKDVDALNAVLRSSDFGGFTKTFAFKNSPSHEILEKIETVLVDAGRDDLVLIYFSGHGKLNPAGQLCLATVNTKIKALGSTSIPVSWIKSYFDHSASQKKILLLDCCYSGAVGKAFTKGDDDQLQLMSRGQGTFIMTASSGIQTAVEKEGDQYGLFTKYLVYGIQSGEADKDEDGFVDMQELYEYVHEKVQEEGTQKPMQWWLQGKGKLVISRSGRESKEQWRQKLRTKLYKMTAKERECLLLIEQLADERISAGDFVESWVKISLTPESPPLSRSKLLLLILAVVSCAAAGAGWYFFREPPPVSVELSKISVALRTLPSLSQIKLQPLSPLPSPVNQEKIPVPPSPVVPPPEEEPEQEQAIVSTIGQYIDHGNGTVTDTKTGLMWKRCSEGLSGDNCEEGKIEEYTWYGARERFKNVEYAGYTDWRLPTADELKTLMYCSKGVNKKNGRCNTGSEKPTINQKAFPNTEVSDIWSGSPYSFNSDDAWLVYFNVGSSYSDIRLNNYAVRLVRGGQ